jgi:uncharacterized membrane protein
MIPSRDLYVSVGFVALSIAIAVWGYVILPASATLPVHYGLIGARHLGHLPRQYALAIMPAVAIVVLTSMCVSPRLRGLGIGPEGNAGPYGLLMMGLAAVFCVTEAAIVEWMRNPAFDLVRLVFLAVAALLVVVGNYLGKVRHNAAFGLKTPWTLRNERVWDKTHRVVARLMVAGGLGLAAACILIPSQPLLIGVMVVLTAGPPLYGIGYSRRAYRREAQA